MGIETITYTNGEITVVWQPKKCIHSGVCVRGLQQVFDPGRRPWIDMAAADSQAITDQVSKCPSGALRIAEPPVTPAD